MLFLGLFTLALLAADPLEELLRREFEKRPPSRRSKVVRAVGVLHGFLCGLLGISGGVITIPLQQVMLRVPAREAIAASLLISAICTFAGSTVAIIAGVMRGDFSLDQLVPILIVVGVGATIGAQLGARICGLVNSAVLRLLFVVVCAGAGLAILL